MMLFNSVDFAIFLPIVFAFYWLLSQKRVRLQNILLLCSSYVFYGWWDWRFLILIFVSSLIDFLVGLGLAKATQQKRRRILLTISIIANLGFLGFFKYFNFFSENFAQVFSLFGKPLSDPIVLNVILPVGISFYTFQTLSYSIDVYRRKIEPTRDAVAFFAFVSFFPQLVAGPIERAANLLPQFAVQRTFGYDSAVNGMRQILWGLFKKMVIADNCAVFVNEIFANQSEYSGSTLLLGAVFFAFQIYCDFSGYSDIAIGVAALFGFKLMRNFAFPYFSRDVAEFWRRWHISLSTWFRDYVYVPMGGSRGGKWMQVRNVFLVFLTSGFWHGASWNFIIWGAIHAACFLPLMWIGQNRKHTNTVAEGRWLPSIGEALQMAATFLITTVAWVFFRADSTTHAVQYLSRMCSESLFALPASGSYSIEILVLIAVLLAAEWVQRERLHALDFDGAALPRFARWGIYYTIIGALLVFGGEQQQFIYFQF